MKWLFFVLLIINVVLFVVQVKDKNGSEKVNSFVQVNGSKTIRLMKDISADEIGQQRCIVIGEIEKPQDLNLLVAYLQKKKITHQLIEKEVILAPNYWVYISKDSDELRAELEKQKMDSYVISSGELKGKLSVGMFANIDLAQDVVNRLKKANISAELMERKKIKISQWVSFGLDQFGPQSLIAEEIEALKINVGEIKEFFCKSIASEK